MLPVACEACAVSRILRLNDVRAACLKLLDTAEERFGLEIDLDSRPEPVGTYWSFESGTSFALLDHPELRIAAGDVFDDLEEINALLTEREPGEIYLWHDLEHLAHLLLLLAYFDSPPGDAPASGRDVEA